MTNNPIDPRGRLTRRAYLPSLVLANLALLGVMDIPSQTAGSRLMVVMGTILVVWAFYCTWSKRLHDIGRNGMLAAINVLLVSAAGIILNTQSGQTFGLTAVGLLSLAMISGGYIMLAPPHRGPNIHGPDPRLPVTQTGQAPVADVPPAEGIVA
jgi:uncharacterized membrane protein YhaH (DUF805 family)